jgi:hypothetical protein
MNEKVLIFLCNILDMGTHNVSIVADINDCLMNRSHPLQIDCRFHEWKSGEKCEDGIEKF